MKKSSKRTTKQKPILEHPGKDAMEMYWGLSRANYLTIPRIAIQTMSDEWQGQFAALLSELDAEVESRGLVWPPPGLAVHCILRRIPQFEEREDLVEEGIAVFDPWSQYRNRKLW